MKKNIFTFLLILILGTPVFASNSDLFRIDFDAVHQEFAELNMLESMIEANPELTYRELKMINMSLIESLNLVPVAAAPLADGEAVLGIPSFWWGCGLGLVGVGIVYFMTEKDSSEAKKALWGCILGALFWGGSYYYTGIF